MSRSMYMLWRIIRAHIRATHDPLTMMWEIWQKLVQKNVKIYVYDMQHYKSSYKDYTWFAHYDVGNLAEIGTKKSQDLCIVYVMEH